MKIPDQHLNGLSGNATGGPERARASQTSLQPGDARTPNRPADGGDHVQLSNLSQAVNETSEDTPERLDKVYRLRELYQSGQLGADSHELSRRIVDDALGGGF